MERAAVKIDVTLRFANGGRLCLGDVALIESVQAHRSIIGAGRATGISYRKCWLMVDALNRTFESPVIATFPGRRTGGATLTPFGARLIALYKSIVRRSISASGAAMVELNAALNPSYRPRASDGVLEARLDELRPRQSQQP